MANIDYFFIQRPSFNIENQNAFNHLSILGCEKMGFKFFPYGHPTVKPYVTQIHKIILTISSKNAYDDSFYMVKINELTMISCNVK